MYDDEGKFEGNYFKEYQVSYENGYILIEATPRLVDYSNSSSTPDYERLRDEVGENVDARGTMALKIDRIRFQGYVKIFRDFRWQVYEAREYALSIKLHREWLNLGDNKRKPSFKKDFESHYSDGGDF